MSRQFFFLLVGNKFPTHTQNPKLGLNNCGAIIRDSQSRKRHRKGLWHSRQSGTWLEEPQYMFRKLLCAAL